jgi:hypothetical protein
MIIDCDTCEVRGVACGDCVVAVMLGSPPELSDDEQRAIGVLAAAGLIPPLRLAQAAQSDEEPTSGGETERPGQWASEGHSAPEVRNDTPPPRTRAV